MNSTKELNKIKKLYGEKFMHLCRQLFPSLLEHEGLLIQILTSNFATNSKTLYEDIVNSYSIEEFKSFIYGKIDVEKDEPEIIEKRTPYELLEEAGYDLYECTTEDEIQRFKKYYKPGETLCTFSGGRLKSCVVFFAIKKDIDDIKRENFKSPKREDEYGTSVMSIQFTKHGICTVSIKNRYNHTVNNPDATYGNDLNRIAPGLEQSFRDLLKERGLELGKSNVDELDLEHYTIGPDGKYYKYNCEINGIYYCPGNVIIDHGKIIELESEKQELIDYFIVDKQTKRVTLYDQSIEDSFIDGLENISNIDVKKDKETGNRIIIIKTTEDEKPVSIVINKDNAIIEYNNENLTEINDYFLSYNKWVTEINLPNVEKIGDGFLYCNEWLTKINLPNVKTIGDFFIATNKRLAEINLPNVETIGDGFLQCNKELTKINLPNVKTIGDFFIAANKRLAEINLPNVETIGNDFIFANKKLTEISLPKVKTIGDCFLKHNRDLAKISLPKVKTIGNYFLESNEELTEINLPNLKNIGSNFLYYNTALSAEKDRMKALNNSIKVLTAKDIAEVDRDNQLTTTEIRGVRRFFERLRNFFRGNNREQ